MRRFSFTLEKVLKVRRIAEKRQKQEVFECQRRRTEERRRREVLQTEIQRSTVEARERAAQTFDLSLERAFCDYLQCLNGRLARCRERVRTLDKELEQKLHFLLQVRKAVRALERLRERRFAGYRVDQNRREQRTFDELAVVQHSGTA